MSNIKPAGILMDVPIDNIIPNRANARTNFDDEALKTLAASIAATGLQQLPVVAETKDRPGVYELESGERRWRACKLLKWAVIPCLVKKRESLAESDIAGLAENIQRENLSTYDLAHKLHAIRQEHKLTRDTIGKMLGISPAHVGKLISLVENLSGEVKALWKKGEDRCTVEFLNSLTKVPRAEQMNAFRDPNEGEAGTGEGGKPRSTEPKHNVKKAAEKVMAAILKMSKDDVAAINARECVSFILGGRGRPPTGISFAVDKSE